MDSTINATFINNTASGKGGAVHFGSVKNVIINGRFIDNRANNGGANYFVGAENTNIAGDFINNTASGDGGANYFYGSEYNIVLTGNFINNSANEGCAFYSDELITNATITGNFINNAGKSLIYVPGKVSNGVVQDSIIINNNVDITIKNPNWKGFQFVNSWFGNNATGYDIKPEVGDATIDNWLFLNATEIPDELSLDENFAFAFKLQSYNGSSVGDYDASKMNVKLNLSQTLGELNQNIALIGEEISYTAKEVGNASITAKLENASYTVNLKNYLDTWYVDSSATTSGDGKTKSTAFKTLKEAIDVVSEGQKIKIASGTYTGDNNTGLIIDKNNLTIMKYGDGEAIFDAQESNRILTVNATTINITGLTFKNGKENKGAAIYFESALTDSFINVTAVNNNMTCNANNDGGAVYFNGALTNVTVTGNFINNTVNNYSGLTGGAAIYFKSVLTDVTITGNFFNNSVKDRSNYHTDSCGGAIYFCEKVENSNINATFIKNTAFLNGGGAIYFYGSLENSNITSTFINNTVLDDGTYSSRGGGGGAIYFYGNLENSNINSTFINNSARLGGATYFSNTLTDVTLTGKFINNIAVAGYNNEGGGANYFKEVLNNVDISGDFINNTVTKWGNYNGGGVNYFLSELNNVNISGNFIKNYACEGGVNYFSGLPTNISISGNYINNTATFASISYFGSLLTNADITGIYLNNDANYMFYINDISSNNIIIHDSILFDEARHNNIINDRSGNAQIINNWFGNTADDYSTPKKGAKDISNWLFLNATANPNEIGIDEISGITFKLQLYNNSSISDYNASKIGIKLDLSQELGELNQNSSQFDEEISYTAKQKGEGSVTAKFESVSYTIHLNNMWGTLVVIDNVTDGVFNTTAPVVNYTPKFESDVTVFTINKTDGTAVVYNKNIDELYDELFKLGVGNYTITLTAVKDEEVYNATSDVFTVCKASSSIIISPIAEVAYGEDTVINFTVINSTQVSWEIIDRNSSLIVDNGTGLDNISNVYAVGEYSITITNALSDIYNASSATMNFTVIKADSIVNIEDINSVVYGNNVEVSFNVTHPTLVTYVVTRIDGSEVVHNTTITDIYENLVLFNVTDVGEYIITIANAENENYNGDVKFKEFNITKIEVTANVTADTVTYGNNVIVNVTGNYSGVYSVTVNGITKNVNVTPGEFVSVDFGVLAANTTGYSIVATFIETPECVGIANATEVVIVNKADSLITIEDIEPVVYGNNVTVDFNVENATSVTYIVEKDGNVVIPNTTITDTLILSGLGAGDYVITIANAENENYSSDVKSKEFSVNKANVTVYVTADSVIYGSNVIVNVTGSLAGEYSVTVNGITRNATVTTPGEFASVDFGVLAANVTGHAILANYIETANYTGVANTTETVIVEKAVSLIIISEIATVIFGENVTVSYNVINLTEVTYTVKTDDGRIIIENATIADADADLIIPGIGAGDYIIIITNAENANYTAYSSEAKFKVLKADTSIEPNVTSPRVVDGPINITFTLPAGIDGIVNVSVDGISVSVTNVSDVYTAVLPNLTFGNHTVFVNLTDDSNYNDATGNITFDVSKADPKITISDIVCTAGETVNVNITIEGGDATGIVLVDIGDNKYYANFENGRAAVKVIGLTNGNYTVNAIYHGDDKYTEATCNASIEVNAKSVPKINVTVSKVKVGENATVTVDLPADATGNVMAIVDGKNVSSLIVSGGTVELSLGELAAGNHTVMVSYSGNAKYEDIFEINNLTVEKLTTDVTGEPVEITEGETVTVVVNVDVNATGAVVVDVGSNKYYTDVEGGVASVNVTGLTAGEYTANITYLGDDNFNEAMTIVYINVKNITLENTTISADVEINDNNVTITVNVDSNATGFVKFDVAGAENYTIYLLVEDGQAVLENVLTVGDYTVNVTYLGDDKFNANSTSKSFRVLDHVKLNTTVNCDVVVNGMEVSVTVNVNETAATGFVEFNIGDKNYYAPVENGQAVLVADFAPGTYMGNVQYLGDENFNGAMTLVYINVEKTTLENTTISADVEINDNNVTITVNINPNATGFVKFDVAGAENYTLYVLVEDGQAVLEDVLTVGDYTVNVTYLGDDKFNMNSTNESFTVTGHVKNDTEISAVSSVDGTTVTITATVDSNATGFVTIGVLGQSFLVPVKDGKAVFTYDFNPGIYSANVVYLGDDNFNNASKTISFNVIKHDAQLKNTTIEVDVNAVENDVTITAKVDSLASGFIGFDIDGQEVYVIVNNGNAVYSTNLPAGNYTVAVTYLGDEKYAGVNTTVSFIVDEGPEPVVPEVNITTPVDFKIGEPANVTVSIPNATGNVSVIVDGIETTVPLDENGTAVVTIDEITPGEHGVVVVYDGDGKYAPFHNSTTFYAPVFVSEFRNLTVDADGLISGVLVSMDVPIANAAISYIINGIDFNTTTDENGMFSFNATFPATVDITYNGTDAILPVHTEITLKDLAPARTATMIKAEDYTTYAIDYYVGERGNYFKVQLVDVNGNPIANKEVKIGFNGVVYDDTTNATGWAKLQINLKNAGIYTFAVAFLGDDDYTGSFVVQKITVNKKKTSISAPAKSYKASAKTKKYTVTLKTDKGSSIDGKVYMASGKKVTMKINGKTYTGKTNSKGQVTFSLSISKKGKFQSSVKFEGDTTYDASNKKVIITIK